ncbi:MAG: TIGR04282 family arsenosugar biosynthesis glycosyltransferase [bacterium]|nr:TIGR04282 family arsenosugar biosynthesis glycosyltransferase [bacterium]
MRPLLILFTKYPRPGEAKTRLIPALGPQGAAQAHRQMVEHCLKRLTDPLSWDLEVHYGDNTNGQEMASWLGELSLRAQGPGDLGAKMLTSFQEAFARGYQRVVLIGSDCPDLDPSYINQAISALEDHQLVLGPTLDGGYCLIALTGPYSSLFEQIPWSTDQVLSLTLKIAAEEGINTYCCSELADVDEPQDLDRFWAHFPKP